MVTGVRPAVGRPTRKTRASEAARRGHTANKTGASLYGEDELRSILDLHERLPADDAPAASSSPFDLHDVVRGGRTVFDAAGVDNTTKLLNIFLPVSVSQPNFYKQPVVGFIEQRMMAEMEAMVMWVRVPTKERKSSTRIHAIKKANAKN
mgnify:CR=1 FL=1